jgi:pentatricopeptide repeat protein
MLFWFKENSVSPSLCNSSFLQIKFLLYIKKHHGSHFIIHAYAVGRDMEEALHCVRKMIDEGIEMSIVTYNIIVGGFAKVGNAE